jgi:GAF domain-containing protein
MKSTDAGLNFGGLKHVLSDAVRGAPYDVILQSLLDEARRLINEDSWAAVYLMDEPANQLCLAAATGIPPQLTAALATLAVDPAGPPCGRAAHAGQILIVEDLREEASMQPWLPLAEAHGIRSCWSFPLHSRVARSWARSPSFMRSKVLRTRCWSAKSAISPTCSRC